MLPLVLVGAMSVGPDSTCQCNRAEHPSRNKSIIRGLYGEEGSSTIRQSVYSIQFLTEISPTQYLAGGLGGWLECWMLSSMARRLDGWLGDFLEVWLAGLMTGWLNVWLAG